MSILGKRPRRLLAGVGVTAVIACGFVLPSGTALAEEPSSDQPIALQSDQGESVLDVTGEALSVLSDSNELGERVILAENENGDPAKVVVQSAPAADLTNDRLFEPEESSAPFVEEAPELVVEELPSTLLTGDEAEWSVTSSFATTETTASFRWDEAVDGFSAVMDGSRRAASSGEVVTFDNLEPGTSHEVVLTGPIGNNGGVSVESQKTFSITTLGDTKSDAGSAARTYQPYTTAYLHKTFIPPASVGGAMCNWGNQEYTFKGDNRGYRMPAADTPFGTRDYRTMMFANINWDNPAPYTVVTAKDVGQSTTLKNGAITHQSYAPSDQMKFEEIQSGGAYAQVRFNHSAQNPHCKIIDFNYGGSIRYNEIVRFYRSGIVEVVGYRRAAPAHEMYARFSNAAGIEAWTIVSRRDNQGFNCLVETFCALDNYALSKTY